MWDTVQLENQHHVKVHKNCREAAEESIRRLTAQLTGPVGHRSD